MRTRPSTGNAISVEAASMLCGIAFVFSDPLLRTHAFSLALRSSTEIRNWLEPFAPALGINPESPELSLPVSKEEVKTFLAPVLGSAARLASLGHMMDEYMWDLTPDGVAYLFYLGIRFAIAGERLPLPNERHQIWELTWKLTKLSHIGGRHWAKLENEGGNALKDWKDQRQEAARKKYETFLRQKKKVDESAHAALETMMSIFD